MDSTTLLPKHLWMTQRMPSLYAPEQPPKPYKGLQAGRRIQFKNEDYQYIKTDFDENVEFITSRIYKNVAASFRNEKNNYSLRAVHPDHQYLEKTKVYQGRYINQRDMDLKTKVVVIGSWSKKIYF